MDYPLSRAVELGLQGGKFTDGVPGLYQASINPSATMNALIDEVLAVITAAGIAPDEENLSQLLTALRSAGVFQTAAQFDSSTKAATTAFVQRALGSFRDQINVTGPSTLTAAHVGVLIGANGGTITLPLASSCPAGSIIYFVVSTNTTIAAQGTDTLQRLNGVTGSIPLLAQTFAVMRRRLDGGGWALDAGDAALPWSAQFSASLGTSGYRKLPSGDIEQWGTVTTSASADVAVTFPIAFPNAVYQIALGTNMTGANMAGYNTPTLSGMNINAFASSGSRSVANVSYRVIGK